MTGLVISTWLNLTLSNFAAWKTIHVIASIGTLTAVVVKLGVHWRWIVATARRYILQPIDQPQSIKPVPAHRLGRREFLRLMGGVSVVAVVAGSSAVVALKQTSRDSPGADGDDGPVYGSGQHAVAKRQYCVRCPKNNHCSYPGQCRRYTDSNNNGKCDLGECA